MWHSMAGMARYRSFRHRVAEAGWRRRVAAIFVVAGAVTAAPIFGQPIDSGWQMRPGVVVGANPTVVGLRGDISYVAPLYRQRRGVLWDSSQVQGGVAVLANPSFTDVSARAYLEPIAVFDVTTELGVRGTYDALGRGLAPLSGYDQPLPGVSGAAYDGRSRVGWFVRVAPRVKGQVGPLIAAHTLTAARYSFPSEGDDVFEESVSLRAVGNNEWVFQNQTQVLVRFSAPWRDVEFAAVGVENMVSSVPTGRDAGQSDGLRVSGMAVAVWRLTPRMSLQSALFIGGYPTGKPFSSDTVHLLTALTATWRPSW